MNTAKREPLVLWGFHPAHGNLPIKLEDYSKAAMKRRSEEGWTCAAYAPGVRPKGLEDQAILARARLSR